ncbi:hypothetical protein BGZ60DRAFT_449292 [Tricladium varicosporioides]|nr:hypothetical protein BGZ60DRAFT_449292 [Hymenoscyphus varicosporioides]
MNPFRCTIPALRSSHKIFSFRNFHYTPHHEAKAIRRPARMVAKSGPNTPGVTRIRKEYGVEESLPPTTLLNAANKSGAINVTADNALDFLRQYHLRSSKPGGWEQGLCQEYNISPTTLLVIAGVLRRCPTKAQQILFKKLLLTASELGEKTATFTLVLEATKAGMLNDFPAPLQRLGILAKQENDPEAMIVLGQVLFSQGKVKEALKWLQKATSPPIGSLQVSGAGDALVTEGVILFGLGDKEGAEIAYKKAALELDEPAGYYHLSQLQEPGSPDQEIYLLKAASSGIPEACHNLGVLHRARMEEEGEEPKSIDEYGMSREWFQIAAAEGFGLSMLNLATMHKYIGEEEEAWRWLESAENTTDAREQAVKMRAQWESS